MNRYINEAVILGALSALGITAAEEYFPDKTPLPYAVVLTPSAEFDGDDFMQIVTCIQTFRVELYTKSKGDPLRQMFIRSMLELGGRDYSMEEYSFGKGNGYMTAIEFSDFRQL